MSPVSILGSLSADWSASESQESCDLPLNCGQWSPCLNPSWREVARSRDFPEESGNWSPYPCQSSLNAWHIDYFQEFSWYKYVRSGLTYNVTWFIPPLLEKWKCVENVDIERFGMKLFNWRKANIQYQQWERKKNVHQTTCEPNKKHLEVLCVVLVTPLLLFSISCATT